MARPTRSGKDQKKKRTNLLTKINNALKIRKLKDKNKRGRVVSTKKKGLSNIPVKERSATVNKKAKGLATLKAGYKKQEASLSKKASEKSAKISKARYPKMGTYKGKNTTSTTSTTTTPTKKMSAIEKRNRKRFGDAHVDRLKARYAEFKKKRKK